jgi:epoxyqueuosine reductase QueG
MEERIRAEIVRFVAESPLNLHPSGGFHFDPPLVGFAAAGDPIFADYQQIIGPFHLTPGELLPGAASVVSWILPVARTVRESNRRETVWPSRQWAQTRCHGEKLNAALRRHLVEWLETSGHAAVAPQLSPQWREYAGTPVGIASAWSERHAAHAAGLGTFSLSDGLITAKGIAHRCGSVVTALPLAPTPRSYPSHLDHCLWYREGSCGACIGRCPVGAISKEGHDKGKCRDYVYGTVPAEVGERYGTPQTGCGLCQTKVPCEATVPPGKARPLH